MPGYTGIVHGPGVYNGYRAWGRGMKGERDNRRRREGRKEDSEEEGVS